MAWVSLRLGVGMCALAAVLTLAAGGTKAPPEQPVATTAPTIGCPPGEQPVDHGNWSSCFGPDDVARLARPRPPSRVVPFTPAPLEEETAWHRGRPRTA